MRSWPPPSLPGLPGSAGPVTVHDTASGGPVRLRPGPVAGLYVCGITPYDATHLGHAATYVTFDLLGRLLRDAGHEVAYVQNVTDVDDPLFERAERDGVDWRDLGAREIELFREDMAALRVIPPDHFDGVVESIEVIAEDVAALLASGAAYRLPVEDGPGHDVYLDLAQRPTFGDVSHWTREEMLSVYAERGGDPDRPGKRDVLDPLLWRAERPGEPSWDLAGLGPGRPGWHIECTAISRDRLGIPFDVQGGGTDLVFPHHEMSATQGEALTGDPVFARAYVHQAMVGYEGHKMSKSRGNLVLVSRLRASGVDPMAVRLLLLAQRHRVDWEYTDALLEEAERRLDLWQRAVHAPAGAPGLPVVEAVRDALRDDLDSPSALAAVDTWAYATCSTEGGDPSSPALVRDTVDALLGIALRPNAA